MAVGVGRPSRRRGREEWLAAEFTNERTGVIVGRNGAASEVKAHAVQPLPKPETGLRHARAVRISPRGEIWIAGDGGLLLKSDPAGRDWSAPQLPLPQSTLAQIEFRAIAIPRIALLAGRQPWNVPAVEPG